MTLYKLIPEIVIELNERLNNEYYAMYFYRNASNWCKNRGYSGGAAYFAKEAMNEMEHAKGIEDFMTDWNIQPELKIIDVPDGFSDLPDIIYKAYELEYDLCDEYKESAKLFLEKDFNSFRFIQKYIEIQSESVSEYADLINQLSLINVMNKFEVFYFDKEVLAK